MLSNKARLARINRIAYTEESINVTELAPLLIASKPTDPDPANTSKNRESMIRSEQILKTASLITPQVGRTAGLEKVFKDFPLNLPDKIFNGRPVE